MRKLLPILLALAGLGAGIGAGLALRPEAGPAEALATAEAGESAENAPAEPGEHATPDASGHGTATTTDGHGEASDGTEEYVKLNNQFVVPVVTDGRVSALVVLSVSLQVGAGRREEVFVREPKLRDSFLQVLFDHANAGGFDGVFTSASNRRTLRQALLEAAQGVMGADVSDILITDMMRQES